MIQNVEKQLRFVDVFFLRMVRALQGCAKQIRGISKLSRGLILCFCAEGLRDQKC